MKTMLTIPFKDKDRAKRLGARWDPYRRQWYCPDAVDLKKFKEWLPDDVKSYAVTERSTERKLDWAWKE